MNTVVSVGPYMFHTDPDGPTLAQIAGSGDQSQPAGGAELKVLLRPLAAGARGPARGARHLECADADRFTTASRLRHRLGNQAGWQTERGRNNGGRRGHPAGR